MNVFAKLRRRRQKLSEIKKVSGNTRRQATQDVKIVGGKPLKGKGTQIVDQQVRQKPVEIQTKQHEEVVTVRSYTRAKPRKKNDPDIRLRISSPESRQEWEAVKSNQWEPE